MKIHLSCYGIKINASFYAVLLVPVFSMFYFGEMITKPDHMSCGPIPHIL